VQYTISRRPHSGRFHSPQVIKHGRVTRRTTEQLTAEVVKKRLLRRNDVFTRRTLGPDTLCSIVFLVFNQQPRSCDTLATVWAPPETLRIVRHGKGMEGACDSVPSTQKLPTLGHKRLATVARSFTEPFALLSRPHLYHCHPSFSTHKASGTD
jgi:hypothetical protein